MAIWKMILQTTIILLITQSSIQSETIDRQHFLFKKLPDVAIPSFYTHVRIPFPLQPIINRLDEAIKELTHQKLVSAQEKNKDTTNTILTMVSSLSKGSRQSSLIFSKSSQQFLEIKDSLTSLVHSLEQLL